MTVGRGSSSLKFQEQLSTWSPPGWVTGAASDFLLLLFFQFRVRLFAPLVPRNQAEKTRGQMKVSNAQQPDLAPCFIREWCSALRADNVLCLSQKSVDGDLLRLGLRTEINELRFNLTHAKEVVIMTGK